MQNWEAPPRFEVLPPAWGWLAPLRPAESCWWLPRTTPTPAGAGFSGGGRPRAASARCSSNIEYRPQLMHSPREGLCYLPIDGNHPVARRVPWLPVLGRVLHPTCPP